MWTLTTFAYEIDRSKMPQKYQRPFSDICEKLFAILNQLKGSDCVVRVYCDDEVLFKVLKDYHWVETIRKPLHTWPAFAFTQEMQQIVDNFDNGTYPEQVSAQYSMAVLSKLDAMLETAQKYPELMHMWLDAGYRWDVSELNAPYWPSISQIYVPIKRFPLETKNKYFGGCWGGSARALMSLKDSFDEIVPRLIAAGQPFTEETVMQRVKDAHPSLIYDVNLHSRGPFPQGRLDQMIQFMVAGADHERLRKLVSFIDIGVLIFTFVLFLRMAFFR
jgi:hypothetical protein